MGNFRVLCVDDEPVILRTTELILRSKGYTVSGAANAGDAFQLLKSKYFDLLLLDCIRDRRWVVQEAKRVNPNMRVAVHTGDLEVRDLPDVDVVLHKPLSPLDLLTTIANLCMSQSA
jgi:CheY-like chemotaxis protein